MKSLRDRLGGPSRTRSPGSWHNGDVSREYVWHEYKIEIANRGDNLILLELPSSVIDTDWTSSVIPFIFHGSRSWDVWFTGETVDRRTIQDGRPRDLPLSFCLKNPFPWTRNRRTTRTVMMVPSSKIEDVVINQTRKLKKKVWDLVGEVTEEDDKCIVRVSF